MKVFIVVELWDDGAGRYGGQAIAGVFATRKQATKFAKEIKKENQNDCDIIEWEVEGANE